MKHHSYRYLLRLAIGWVIIAAGVFHSLYYISGMLGSWEKDTWNLLQVAAGLFLAGLGIWVLVWRHKSFSGRALWLLRLSQSAVVLGLVVFLGTELMIWNAGKRAEPQPSDYLLILGARVKGETVSLSQKARLDQGLAYLKKYPGTPVILSGGQGVGESITEAEAMRRYLVQHGLRDSQVFMEERSTSTYENLIFSRDLLVSQGVDVSSRTFTLITNDFHMLRSELLAHRTGIKVQGFPASTPPYTLPKSYTREFAALLKSLLLDR
jgi:uncharacterized SAM-binding protein YcdF (DUF218 family)